MTVGSRPSIDAEHDLSPDALRVLVPLAILGRADVTTTKHDAAVIRSCRPVILCSPREKAADE
jgi:hypothetical protein